MAERIKIAVAALIAIAGLAAFSTRALVDKQPTFVRLANSCLALLSRWASRSCGSPETGRAFVVFGRESMEEAKRVVWPSRKETLQTTGVVFVFVFVMALFLWFVDAGLLWITQKLLGTGG